MYGVLSQPYTTNHSVWGAESAIHHKPHSVHSLPGNTLRAVPLICMAAMVQIYIYTRGQPHPKYRANSARTSHIAVWERDPQSLGVTGDELHDGPERGPRGPVDRDGARSTKSKHSSSSIRGLRVSPGRFVGL